MGIEKQPIITKQEKDREWKNKALKTLIDIKENYSDDLPKDRIETTENEQDNKYKCRTNIFGGALSMINLLVEEGIIKEDEEIKKILEHAKTIKFHMTAEESIAFNKSKQENPHIKYPTFRTEEDIKFLNNALDYVIGLLSNN